MRLGTKDNAFQNLPGAIYGIPAVEASSVGRIVQDLGLSLGRNVGRLMLRACKCTVCDARMPRVVLAATHSYEVPSGSRFQKLIAPLSHNGISSHTRCPWYTCADIVTDYGKRHEKYVLLGCCELVQGIDPPKGLYPHRRHVYH
jgi:hypothetical protein